MQKDSTSTSHTIFTDRIPEIWQSVKSHHRATPNEAAILGKRLGLPNIDRVSTAIRQARALLTGTPAKSFLNIATAEYFLEQLEIDGTEALATGLRSMQLAPNLAKHASGLIEIYRQRLEDMGGDSLNARGSAAPPSLRGTALQIASDIKDTEADESLTQTQRKALVDARVGQGRFRSELMREFNRACALSSVDVSEALRASHIVPWRASTNAERINPKNGLLLSANLDTLFDQYLITFSSNGDLIYSTSLNERQRGLLGLPEKFQLKLCEQRKEFMRQHALEFDKRLAATKPRDH